MAMQIVALVILAVFYGTYFVKMLMQKRQGIQTDQMGKGKQGKEKIIELTLKAVTIAVPVAEVASILINTAPLPFWLRWVGMGLAVAGTTLFFCTVLAMHDNWRAGVSHTDKTDLVTDGLFTISRNPAFLGFDLVYLGILLMFFNWILLALSLFAALMLHLQITQVEEKFLEETFGQQYLDYKKRVNRYFGPVP